MRAAAWWALAALLAAAGLYGVFSGMGPLWTLLAGLGAGVTSAAALRAGRERE